MVRRFSLALDIDERTKGLSPEALICRSQGHLWERKAASRKHTMELLADGFYEYNRFCRNNCGSTWRTVWNLRTKSIVEDERNYPRNGQYLLPKGSGRLSRGDAVVAEVCRNYAGLV